MLITYCDLMLIRRYQAVAARQMKPSLIRRFWAKLPRG